MGQLEFVVSFDELKKVIDNIESNDVGSDKIAIIINKNSIIIKEYQMYSDLLPINHEIKMSVSS